MHCAVGDPTMDEAKERAQSTGAIYPGAGVAGRPALEAESPDARMISPSRSCLGILFGMTLSQARSSCGAVLRKTMAYDARSKR